MLGLPSQPTMANVYQPPLYSDSSVLVGEQPSIRKHVLKDGTPLFVVPKESEPIQVPGKFFGWTYRHLIAFIVSILGLIVFNSNRQQKIDSAKFFNQRRAFPVTKSPQTTAATLISETSTTESSNRSTSTTGVQQSIDEKARTLQQNATDKVEIAEPNEQSSIEEQQDASLEDDEGQENDNKNEGKPNLGASIDNVLETATAKNSLLPQIQPQTRNESAVNGKSLVTARPLHFEGDNYDDDKAVANYWANMQATNSHAMEKSKNTKEAEKATEVMSTTTLTTTTQTVPESTTTTTSIATTPELYNATEVTTTEPYNAIKFYRFPGAQNQRRGSQQRNHQRTFGVDENGEG